MGSLFDITTRRLLTVEDGREGEVRAESHTDNKLSDGLDDKELDPPRLLLRLFLVIIEEEDEDEGEWDELAAASVLALMIGNDADEVIPHSFISSYILNPLSLSLSLTQPRDLNQSVLVEIVVILFFFVCC